jgi:hypothetical protein
MNTGTSSSSLQRVLRTRSAHVLGSLLLSLAMGASWLPGATADSPPAASPIRSSMDTDVATCQARGGTIGRNHDGFAICMNAKQASDVYRTANGLPPATPAAAATSPASLPQGPAYSEPAPPPAQPASEPAEPAPAPEPESEPASGGHALLIAGIVAAGVLGGVAIAAAAASAASSSTTTSGSGGGCSITFAQCCPQGSNSGQVCAPDRGGCANSTSSCPSGTSGFSCNGDPNGCGAFFSAGEVGCTC